MKIRRSVTMEDIARMAHVSKPTVSRALRNSPLVTPETRKLVMDLAQKHGYVVNRNAQKLRQSRSDTIAVVLDFKSHRENRISDPFIFNLLAGVSEALGQREQDLLLCAPGHAEIESLSAIIASRGADGIIFLGEGERRPDFVDLAALGVPFVVWGSVEQDQSYCAVGSDNFHGGFLAGQHLLDRGRSRFLFVGDSCFHEISQRRQGLVAALAKSDKPTHLSDLIMDGFSYASTLEAARAMIESDKATVPDAVFAASDTAAMALISALGDAGLSVPGDVSVVGYNNIPGAEYFSPPLTTIGQDVHMAGALLVEKLMLHIEGRAPASTMLDTRLIVRESS